MRLWRGSQVTDDGSPTLQPGIPCAATSALRRYTPAVADGAGTDCWTIVLHEISRHPSQHLPTRVSTYQRESALTNSSFTLASKLKWATDALAMSVLAALAMEEDPSFQPAIERTDGRAWLS